YPRLQFLLACPLCVRWFVHVSLSELASPDDIFGVYRRPGFHGVRIHVRSQRSRIHHLFRHLAASSPFFRRQVHRTAPDPFHSLGGGSTESFDPCRFSTNYPLRFGTGSSLPDNQDLLFDEVEGMERETQVRGMRSIHFIFLGWVARLTSDT